MNRGQFCANFMKVGAGEGLAGGAVAAAKSSGDKDTVTIIQFRDSGTKVGASARQESTED